MPRQYSIDKKHKLIMRTFTLLACTGLLFCAFTQLSQADEIKKADSQSHKIPYWKYLVLAVSEGTISLAENMVPRGSFSEALLNSNKFIVRDALNKDVTNTLSSNLEQTSYQLMTSDAAIKKTANMSLELIARARKTKAHTSTFAQKGLKAYLRFDSINNTPIEAINRCISHLDEDCAPRMLAFMAFISIYNYPEYSHNETAQYIKPLFRTHPELQSEQTRQRTLDIISFMDPVYDEMTLIQLNYCQLLNSWHLGFESCDIYKPMAEKESRLLAGNAGNFQQLYSYLSSLISEDHLHDGLFVFGLVMPALIRSLKPYSSSLVNTVLERYTMPVVGKTLVQDKAEKLSSSISSKLEDIGMHGLRTNRTDFAHKYFEHMQSQTSKRMSQLTNFARSNIQRTLDTTLKQLDAADQHLRLYDFDSAYTALAALNLNLMHEAVESDARDIMIRSALIAYRPVVYPDAKDRIEHLMKRLKPDDFANPEIHSEHRERLMLWEQYSTATIPSRHLKKLCNIDAGTEYLNQTAAMDSATCSWCENPNLNSLTNEEPYSQSTFYIHALIFSYYMISHYGFNRAKATFLPEGMKLAEAGKYSAMAAFSLQYIHDWFNRSLPNFSIKLLKDSAKSATGRLTGTLSTIDAIKHKVLLTEELKLSSRLNAEAQISRSYKGSLESLLIEFWKQASFHLQRSTEPLRAARTIAYAAYYQRALYPEYQTSDVSLTILARGQLQPVTAYLNEVPSVEREAFNKELFNHLALLDPNFSDQHIQMLYIELLSHWRILPVEGEDQLSSTLSDDWLEYSDLILMALGSTGKIVTQTYFRSHHIAIRVMLNMMVSIVEQGAIESPRKRFEMVTATWMLSRGASFAPYEATVVDTANTELKKNYRSLQVHFTQTGYGARNTLTLLISDLMSAMRRGSTGLL